MTNDAEQIPPAQPRKKWVFPGNRPTEDSPPDADEAPNAVLCSLPEPDGIALCARLESEGIVCDVLNKPASESGPAATQEVCVVVTEADLPRAREVLAGSDDGTVEEKRAFERDIAEINISDWVCPECRRRTLKVLPLPIGLRRLRNACLAYMVLPVLFSLGLTLPKELADAAEGVWQAAWIVCFIVFTWIFVVVKRDKQCTRCGWATPARP